MSHWDGSSFQAQARTRRFTDTLGFFCDIGLHITSLDTEERRIEGPGVPPRFRGAIAFGIDYALARLGYFGGWEANVQRFEHHAVDTTAEVVALTTARAVLESFGYEEQPTLDLDRGVVAFPK